MVAVHREEDSVGQCAVVAVESERRWEVASPNVVVQRFIILQDGCGCRSAAGRESYEITVIGRNDGDARTSVVFGEMAVDDCISVDAIVAAMIEIGSGRVPSDSLKAI